MNQELDPKLTNTPPQSINLDVTINEVNVILAALQELPYRVSDSVIKKVMQQAQSQLQV